MEIFFLVKILYDNMHLKHEVVFHISYIVILKRYAHIGPLYFILFINDLLFNFGCLVDVMTCYDR